MTLLLEFLVDFYYQFHLIPVSIAIDLKELHKSPLGGYLGRCKLHALVSWVFFCPKLDAILRRFCKECVVYQQSRALT